MTSIIQLTTLVTSVIEGAPLSSPVPSVIEGTSLTSPVATSIEATSLASIATAIKGASTAT